MNRQDVVELVETLEAEVNNGGLDQFFFNDSGNKTKQTIQALEAIGALKMADIVLKAAGRFPGGMPPTEWASRQKVLLQVSPDSDAFEDLDEAF